MPELVYLGGPTGWSSTISRHLGNNLQNNKDSNVTFVCKGGDVISWNGLPLLASLTWFFDVDCCSCQTEATLLLPDHSADAVRAVLLLISRGSAKIGAGGPRMAKRVDWYYHRKG